VGVGLFFAPIYLLVAISPILYFLIACSLAQSINRASKHKWRIQVYGIIIIIFASYPLNMQWERKQFEENCSKHRTEVTTTAIMGIKEIAFITEETSSFRNFFSISALNLDLDYFEELTLRENREPYVRTSTNRGGRKEPNVLSLRYRFSISTPQTDEDGNQRVSVKVIDGQTDEILYSTYEYVYSSLATIRDGMISSDGLGSVLACGYTGSKIGPYRRNGHGSLSRYNTTDREIITAIFPDLRKRDYFSNGFSLDNINIEAYTRPKRLKFEIDTRPKFLKDGNISFNLINNYTAEDFLLRITIKTIALSPEQIAQPNLSTVVDSIKHINPYRWHEEASYESKTAEIQGLKAVNYTMHFEGPSWNSKQDSLTMITTMLKGYAVKHPNEDNTIITVEYLVQSTESGIQKSENKELLAFAERTIDAVVFSENRPGAIKSTKGKLHPVPGD